VFSDVSIMRLNGHQIFVESDIKFIDVGHHGCDGRIGGSGVEAQNGVANSIPIDGANGLKREHTEFDAGVGEIDRTVPC
jgi:hypothetical protein